MRHRTEESDHQETAAEMFDRLFLPAMASLWAARLADAAQRRQGDWAMQEDRWGTT